MGKASTKDIRDILITEGVTAPIYIYQEPADYIQNYAIYAHENSESKKTVGDKTKEVLKIISDKVKMQ